MKYRTTKVKQIKVDSVAYSSLIQIGDATSIEPKADAIAVQKEGGTSSDKGFEFEKYPIFDTTIQHFPDPEIIAGGHYHHDKQITAPTINVKAISSSAIVQLGSTDKINSLSRLKHIRMLRSENNET